MTFNELNAVEHFIIHQLSGENLNLGAVSEAKPPPYKAEWQYCSSEELDRGVNEVLVESELRKALIRINPEIQQNPALADEVIYKLRAILISVNQTGLVRANEEFTKWLQGEKTMPFGENNRHVPVRLIDFEKLTNNTYIITNQFRVHHRETKIPDIVLLINGIPVVVGEAKTPIRPSISWLDGAHEIHDIYENAIPQLFVPNILSFATEGKEFFYGSVRCPLELWSPWRLEGEDEELVQKLGLKEVGDELKQILKPYVLLEILRNFSLFSSDKKKRRIKIIPRYQQYDGANKIVNRVKDGTIKQGLIWHFQGSGKSLLMVFAAQQLRRHRELKSPTVIILVDRVDLDTQITSTFNAADVSNMVAVDSIRTLNDLLEKDTRKTLITTIHKFKDATANMNLRHNIIVMADEAHRTQEGDLGRQMRAALPNAFYFGLTGTPVNKLDKNTFWAFGSEQDQGGYLSRYTFQESIRDKATLPLHFEPRLVDVHVDKAMMDKAYKAMVEQAALTDEEADLLSKKAAQMAVFLKSPERVQKIVDDIALHFRQKVQPHGFKAMIVTSDRFACVQYKEALDGYFSDNTSRIVMSTNANDDLEFKRKWGMEKDEQERVLDAFNDKDSELKFLIVTAKLLTGFDSPILQTMYLDKSMKDHTLLQAICRTNRLYPNKNFGCIVDYFGIFDDAAEALQFDEESVAKVITSLHLLKAKLPDAVTVCLAHFSGVDRTIEGFEGLEAAQECIKTDERKDAFAKDYVVLAKLWESLSPDAVLNPFLQDYRWLSQVYQSVQPALDNIGKMLWFAFGAQTTKLIHENIHVGDLHDDLEEFIMDADVIDELFNNPDSKKVKQLEKGLIKRFKRQQGNPKFKALSERLEALRDKAEQGLITSIEFVKELCKLAKETVKAEQETLSQQEQKSAKEALTDLFLEMKTDQTPAVVERIVSDVDDIVKIVRFDGWQTTTSGEREVQRSLRKTLLKYKLHKDQDLFERAYAYVKQYY
ncbi:MAG: type I restriction endonuclease subunit R [Candidatus Marinimicrobia bacterium]|nr:type I restriction endonuclease subunit R [Candidatus Neomarinimicrobiota bacterium]MBT4684820.1 type I restriction endonuclease subunit R [Candidatus Neomarinimicrobiota bacterium]MBT5385941.1 type I restriction endonuclease subunit R [Candidatus Neomarinimicrobiota bacterium]